MVSILIGVATTAIPNLQDAARMAAWAVPVVVFAFLLVPELVRAPYRLHAESIEQRDAAIARLQAVEQAGDKALAAQSRPMLIPLETAPGSDPIVSHEGDTQEYVFALVLQNIGAGPAMNGAFQVVRKGIPGYRYQKLPVMVQFGQTRIDVVPAGGKAQPRLTSLDSFRFIGSSSTPIADELTLEYQSVDGHWYQTIATRQGGRWSDFQQVQIPHQSTREIDQAEVAARSDIGM